MISTIPWQEIYKEIDIATIDHIHIVASGLELACNQGLCRESFQMQATLSPVLGIQITYGLLCCPKLHVKG